MNIQSVAIASGTEAGPAEVMVKVAASAEAADVGTTVETANAEDSAVVTVPAAKTAAMGRTAGSDAVKDAAETTEAQVPLRTKDAAETRTVRTKENGAAAIKRQQTASSQVTEKNGNVRSVKRRKNPASATASPRERDNENSYIFAAKAAVVLLRQIVYS